jgi:ribokinase
MPEERKPVVVVGSINTDLVVTAERLPLRGETIPATGFATFQGGKGANQAVAAALLGAQVKMVGMVGGDAYGAASVEHLRERGIDCEHVGRVEGESGLAVITVGAGGENTILVLPGANALVTPEFVASKRAVIAGAAMVLAQLEIPMKSVLALAGICKEAGVPLMLDPAPAQTLPDGLIALCEWFTPNETEAAFYAGTNGAVSVTATAAVLRKLGAGKLLLKMGEHGALIDEPGVAPLRIAPVAVKAVDTTAAGDTFNGAFAAALAAGQSLAEAGRFAATAAALSVTRAGAQASMPTLAEVRARL